MDEVAAVSRSTALRWARFAAAHLRDLLILLVGLTTLLFFLLRLAGDPAVVIAGADASAEQLAEVRAAYGLDRPIWQQYASYLGRLILFDPGTSLISAEPALEAVLRVLPATLALAMLGMATTLAIAVPLGAWLGARWPTPARRATASILFFLQGVPGFVIALLLVQWFSIRLGLLPALGFGGPATWLLPMISLAAFLAPRLARVIATNVAQAMSEDYIRTARANGARPREVMFGYALPNALLGATALAGTQLAFLVSGVVVIEFIFAWPGVGWLLIESTRTLDFPVVQAIALVVGTLVFTLNTIVDALLLKLDPRLSASRSPA
jgi:peptide/nickel transport system permease protein